MDQETEGKKLDDEQMNKSVVSKQSSLKTPNLVVLDYQFTAESCPDLGVHPILGTPEVRNIFGIDWKALQQAQKQQWAEVCQEHFDAVVKLGNAPSTSSKPAATPLPQRPVAPAKPKPVPIEDIPV